MHSRLFSCIITDMIDARQLRELVHYAPDTGAFTWAKTRPRCRKGAAAGCRTPYGYVVVRVGGGLYMAHRLAWLYQTGAWPNAFIDHIDGDRGNNQFTNLRQATVAENAQNTKKAHRDSKTGFLGVTQRRDGKYVASISTQGKTIFLGAHVTPEDAHAAYLSAKRKMHVFAAI